MSVGHAITRPADVVLPDTVLTIPGVPVEHDYPVVATTGNPSTGKWASSYQTLSTSFTLGPTGSTTSDYVGQAGLDQFWEDIGSIRLGESARITLYLEDGVHTLTNLRCKHPQTERINLQGNAGAAFVADASIYAGNNATADEVLFRAAYDVIVEFSGTAEGNIGNQPFSSNYYTVANIGFINTSGVTTRDLIYVAGARTLQLSGVGAFGFRFSFQALTGGFLHATGCVALYGPGGSTGFYFLYEGRGRLYYSSANGSCHSIGCATGISVSRMSSVRIQANASNKGTVRFSNTAVNVDFKSHINDVANWDFTDVATVFLINRGSSASIDGNITLLRNSNRIVTSENGCSVRIYNVTPDPLGTGNSLQIRAAGGSVIDYHVGNGIATYSPLVTVVGNFNSIIYT